MKRRRITNAEFSGIINRHVKWLTHNTCGGERANLSHADLRRLDIRLALIQYADLSFSDLRNVDLSSSYFVGANLTCADLRGANLKFVDLREATLVDCLVDLDVVVTCGFPLSWWLGQGAIVV